MTGGSMMKWRVRRDSHCNSIEHEDIRQSLEVLDSVLAEFDDCLESWDKPSYSLPPYPFVDYSRPLDSSNESPKKLVSDDNTTNATKCYDSLPNDDKYFNQNNARGGSTSHNSSNTVQEQPKVGSPPPIPKRSPTTRLSEQSLSPFTFPPDDTSLDSNDSNRSDSAVFGDGLSDHVQISGLSLKEDGDTTPCVGRSIPNHINGPDNCANCGRLLKRATSEMETAAATDIPSPFQQRKEIFEAKIAEGASNSSTPTGVNRSYGSSFRVRRTTPMQLASTSEPQSLPANLSESGINSAFLLSNELVSKPITVGGESDVSLPGTRHVVNCSCREKIQKLNDKFHETRRLLKLNSIDGLDSKPPSFVPPPPPNVSGIDAQQNNKLVLQTDIVPMDNSEKGLGRGVPRMNNDGSEMLRVEDSLQDAEVDSFHCVDSSESIRSPCHRPDDSFNSSQSGNSSRLCNRCSSSLSVHLSETIEDLPNLLPTDALNRPHLGLSYSMEDDLSPGVKEIQQTSTPKSDVSSPSLFKTKDSNLSTFSHSASSLGYVSSQSDLELNNLPIVPDKVPVSTFRSRTLPNGLDRSPFYSPVDDEFYSPHEPKDHNGNRYLKLGHISIEDLQLRSSSAPPPPEAEKPKKKHFRFSRKDKKDKKKNDDSLSLKSDLSLDEGIILKKVGTLDGSTVLTDAAADKQEAVGEKKRLGLWRSFIGKK